MGDPSNYADSPAPDFSGSPGPSALIGAGRVGALLDGRRTGRPVKPGRDGRVSITVQLPAKLATGWHTVATRCENADGKPVGGIIQRARFRVPAATLAAAPGAVRRGGQVRITGRYFWACVQPARAGQPSRAPVRLLWHGRLLARVHGAQFTALVTVPHVHAGRYLVAAECGHPRSAALAGPLAHTRLRVLRGPAAGVRQANPARRSTLAAGQAADPGLWQGSGTNRVSPPPSGPADHVALTAQRTQRLNADLAAWITAGSVTGLLVLLLVMLWFCVPQLRAFRCWLPWAAKPKARFDGRDDSAPRVQFHPVAGEHTLSIGIRTRPDPRGWTGHTEVIPDAH